MSAAATYAARVDAVLEQRTRLRGPQPPGDLFGTLPTNSPMMRSNPRRALEPNLALIAEYVQPDDIILDVGGGAGRLSLPLALRCREVVNVDPSPAMLAGFEATAREADIANVRSVLGDWLEVEPPSGTVALVNHVTYLTREIVPFLQKLDATASRRVLVTVNSPPLPTRNRDLFRLLYGETEALMPGLPELVNVLWELGIEPDVRMLPDPGTILTPVPGREAAIATTIARFPTEQWALWALGPELEGQLRTVLETHFDTLFTETERGYAATWIEPYNGREALITWEPRRS